MFEVYEIFPLKSDVSAAEWQNFLDSLPLFHKTFDCYNIEIVIKNHLVRYFLKSPRNLPASLHGVENFLLKRESHQTFHSTKPTSKKSRLVLTENRNNIPKLNSFLRLRFNSELKTLTFSFKKISPKKSLISTTLIDSKNHEFKLPFAIPSTFLAINFKTSKDLLRTTPPSFLDISKSLPLFQTEKSFVAIDTFPYLNRKLFLNPTKADLKKHMVVFGASGSGKSKFLSLIVENYLKNKSYRIIILDPHASLEKDLGGLGNVIDFNSNDINLFEANSAHVMSATELLLDTFKNLLNSNNAKLERVLHHSFFFLITLNKFDFRTLRQLLLDTEFRNRLVSKNQPALPENIVTFFLAEFSEIKTASFNEAIAPVITLLDELEILPAFRTQKISKNFLTTLQENKLTIFSLDRTKLGSRAVETLSSLVMCQLFSLIQNREINEHLIFIIDEVAVIENPILKRFLSESRKFNLTLILAGQYFGAISTELQTAIFANIANYCIFRVSKDDATILINNFNFKLPLNDTEAEKIKLLTSLKDRECILRLSSGGKLVPAFKCVTMDFTSHPRKRKNTNLENEFKNLKPVKFTFDSKTPFSFAKHDTEKSFKEHDTEKPFSFAKPSSKFNSHTSINLHDVLTLTSTRRHSARELMNQK